MPPGRGWRVIDWYVDFGKSGTTFDRREAFQKLRQSVENGHTFGTVICYDESRWGRAIDSEENTYWRFHFRKHGVDVVLVKTSVDPENDFAPMLKAFEGVQASQYSKKLSELTLRGAMNNDIYSSGGTAPYGYRRMARNTKTGIVRALAHGEWCAKGQEKVFWELGDEGEVQTISYIFEERAKGIACVLIAKALNDKGISPAKRGKWRNLDQKWSAGTIKSMIENPAYRGARTYNRFSSSKIIAQTRKRKVLRGTVYPAWRNPEDEWRVVEDAHPAIVTKDRWEKANKANKRRSSHKLNGHSYHSRYLLTGMIKCSKCGFPFQGWSGTVRGKEYLRYIDGGWQTKRACEFFSIPKDLLEDFAVQSIKETLMEPELLRQIEAHLRNMLESGVQGEEEAIRHEKQELSDIEKKLANLIRLAEEGNLAGDAVRVRVNELEQERSRVLARLSTASVPKEKPKLAELEQEVARFVLDFERNFAQAPIEERKMLVQKCISKIEVDRETNVARFYVRRVPAVIPELEEVEKRVNKEESVMSKTRARDRT